MDYGLFFGSRHFWFTSRAPWLSSFNNYHKKSLTFFRIISSICSYFGDVDSTVWLESFIHKNISADLIQKSQFIKSSIFLIHNFHSIRIYCIRTFFSAGAFFYLFIHIVVNLSLCILVNIYMFYLVRFYFGSSMKCNRTLI